MTSPFHGWFQGGACLWPTSPSVDSKWCERTFQSIGGRRRTLRLIKQWFIFGASDSSFIFSRCWCSRRDTCGLRGVVGIRSIWISYIWSALWWEPIDLRWRFRLHRIGTGGRRCRRIRQRRGLGCSLRGFSVINRVCTIDAIGTPCIGIRVCRILQRIYI